MILPIGGHDRVGCFTNQVKLTRALVRDLDEAIKEVKLQGEHEEESSQKITELEALRKKLREDTQRLEEEKATLEGMVESRNELLMPMTEEMPLHPVLLHHHLLCHPTTTPEEIDEEGPIEVILEQEAPVLHEVIPADTKPMMAQLRLYHALMRDYEENPLRLEDDFDDLDDDPSEDRSDMDEWFPDDGSNDRD
jgi:hypothetical protein